MKRLLLGALLAALAAPGMAHAAASLPPLQRPNPIFSTLHLDYINPLPTPTGGVATLEPLSKAVTAAAVADQEYLSYQIRDDLGGFMPAPLGAFALSSGGRNVVGVGVGTPQIPLFRKEAGGKVNAFTFTGGPVTQPPENGKKPVPGLGPPPPVPPASNNTTVPPANGGFGGSTPVVGGTTTTTRTGPHGAATGGTTRAGTTTHTTTRGGTTTTRRPPPTTTTRRLPPPTTTTAVTTTTSATTTTTTTATTTTTGGGGGGGSSGDCGTPGLSITTDAAFPGCRLFLSNAAPGQEVHEVLTIQNTSTSTYTLSLKAVMQGPHLHIWDDLLMGVWEQGTAPPSPLPPLSFWWTQFNTLTTLNPGDTIQYVVELMLPLSAGNADQAQTATVDFTWRAEG